MNRRDFLAHSSFAVAGAGLFGTPVGGSTSYRVPVRSRRPVHSHGPDLPEPDTLQQLGKAAIEAAQRAGAGYADIRIAARRTLDMAIVMSIQDIRGTMTFDTSYGIRACVNGTWAFVAGVDPTISGVTSAAREAVETARALSTVTRVCDTWTPAPVVTGEWRAPVEIDPFSISPDDHASVLAAFREVGERVPGASVGVSVFWGAETRVFASSEGSSITQHLVEAQPSIRPATQPGIAGPPTTVTLSEFAPCSAGFEILVGAQLQDRIRQGVDAAVRLQRYPVGTADVGRYDAVFDGYSLGGLLGETIVPSLELGRALGQEADGAGMSILAPVGDVLGQPIFSEQLTVKADRSLPHFGAAQWDDEGVATESFPVIERGVVVDYFGTRRTTPSLADWYARRTPGRTIASRGTAVAWSPQREPIGAPAAVTVQAGATGTSFDTLVKELGNGIVVRMANDFNGDQQLSGGMCMPSMVFEVKKGVITRRLFGGFIAYTTKPLWKSVQRVGDVTTVDVSMRKRYGGVPWAAIQTAITSPAALLTRIDLSTTPNQ